jgi:acyl-CoA reductase-like NAD-dependent aldehyde dehydrogenase
VKQPLDIRNPRSGEIDYQIMPADRDMIATAATHLRQAQTGWAQAELQFRIDALSALAAAIARHRPVLLEALTQDTGRRAISAIEIDGIASSLQRWSALARKIAADGAIVHDAAIPHISYRYQRVPLGLVGVISPWNIPLTLSLIDAIPALIAGNAVLLKPSEVTPRFAQPLRKILAEVPALAAVMTVIDGDGTTGAELIHQVDAICFTGSVKTGRLVAESAARNFIPAFLELGGNDPAIVLADADVERATTALLRAAILNTGQACQSIERIYVAQSLYDEFLSRLIAKAKGITLNRETLSAGHLGPLISAEQGDVIEAQLADAIAQGAVIHTGGQLERQGGLWCLPTVVTNVNHSMQLMQDETFGPVMPVMPFSTEAEAIALANDTEFGLSAAVFAADRAHAEAIGSQIQAGAISLNDAALTAFVHEAEKNSFKLSGLGGSRMGPAGLLRFCRQKALIWNGGPVMAMEQFNEANFSTG